MGFHLTCAQATGHRHRKLAKLIAISEHLASVYWSSNENATVEGQIAIGQF